MRTSLLLCFLVGLAVGDNGFKSGKEYEYQWRGRTLTSLFEVANQYSGVFVKGKVVVQAKTGNTLVIKLSQPQYASIHANLSQGWETHVPEQSLDFKPLPLSGKPVVVKIHEGLVKNLASPKEMNTWETNIYKGIASQLQLDTQGESDNRKLRSNRIPQLDLEKTVYKTVEAEVEGKCQVQYDVSPLPDYMIENEPWIAPLAKPESNEEHVIEIVKSTNFSECQNRPGYHFGLTAESEGYPGQTQTGDFLARSSVTRAIISGNLNEYIIQSTVKISQTVASPELYNEQKGMVVSKQNLTLQAVRQISNAISEPSDLEDNGDLVYDYSAPFPDSHPGNQKRSPQVYVSDFSSEGYKYEYERTKRNEGRNLDNYQSARSSESNSSEEFETSTPIPFEDQDEDQNRERRSYKSRSYNSRRHSYGNEKYGYKRSTDDNSVDSSSSSDSSSESDERTQESFSHEDTQPQPSMENPPQNPLNPFFVGYRGMSIQAASQMNVAAAAKKLAQAIAQELQEPNSIPEKNTLEKFTILTRLTRTMSKTQLQQLTQELYASPSSPIEKKQAWKAIRDAVAAAGTGPTLSMIADLIESKKIEGEEAAEVVATLAESARLPTQQYCQKLFDIVQKTDVSRQKTLHAAALHSLAEILRRAVVYPEAAHKRYPVHSFGPMSPSESVLTQQVVPYIQQQLQKAVSNGNSVEIQIYLTAAGKLAHPKILSVIEPYLEGKQDITTFQRLKIVSSLYWMTKAYPEVARRVLYNVYQNLGEAPEVRSAAIFLLMRTNPQASMLQRMATSTNYESNQHVKAAVISAIKSAASLDPREEPELQKNAQAAVHLLDSENDLGLQLSRIYLRNYIVKQMNLAYKQKLAWIGSSDSIIPSSVFYSLTQNLGGFKQKTVGTHYMTSSVDNLLDLLEDQFETQKSQRQSTGSQATGRDQWSASKIIDLLNIKPDISEEVEGNVVMKMFGANRFFAFDNHTIQNIPQLAKHIEETLKSGHRIQYTKLYNQFSITIAHPSCMGFPVVYTVKAPTVLSVTGDVRANAQPSLSRGQSNSINIPEEVTCNKNIQLVYSSQLSSKISFFTPFNSQRYIAGLDKLELLNVPVKTELKAQLSKSEYHLTLQPLQPNKEVLVYHSHSLPYTSEHSILNMVPVSQDSNTRPIYVQDPQQMQHTYGERTTGLVFRVECNAQQMSKQSIWNKLKLYDPISLVKFMWTDRTIKNYDIDVYFDGQRSSTNSVTVSTKWGSELEEEEHTTKKGYLKRIYDYVHDKIINVTHFHTKESDESQSSPSHQQEFLERERQNAPSGAPSSSPPTSSQEEFEIQSGSSGLPSANPSSPSPMSSQRRREFLSRVRSSIRDASSCVVDAAITFNKGQNQPDLAYVATVAKASSDVDEKSRILVFLARTPSSFNSQPFQVCVSAETRNPLVPIFKFAQALEANPDSSVQAAVRYGQSCSSGASIDINGQLRRSSEWKQAVRESPETKQCLKEIQEGKELLPACRNATVRASYLDTSSFNIKYNAISNEVKQVAHKVYDFIKYLGYPYLDENIVNVNNPSGQIKARVQFSPTQKNVTVTLEAPNVEARFNDIRLSSLAQAVLIPHPVYSSCERFWTRVLSTEYTPECTLEGQLVNTFDNKTYPAQLENCWYALMVSQPQSEDERNNDSIAVIAKEVGSGLKMIKMYLQDDAVVEIRPQQIDKSQSPSNAPVNVYVNGKQLPVSKNHLASVEDRRETDENLVELFATQDGVAVVRAPEHGLELITDGKHLKLKASNSYRDNVVGLCGTFNSEEETDFTNPQQCILRSPQQFVKSYAIPDGSCSKSQENPRRCVTKEVMYTDVIKQADYEGRHQNRESSSQQPPRDCTSHQIKIISQEDKICFTKDRIPTCKPGCQPKGETLKKIPFYCPNDSPAARNLADKVRRGNNVNLNQKPTDMERDLYIPRACVQQ